MAHLVQAMFLCLPEITRVIERVILEKEANLVARLDEVTVFELFLLRRRKHAADFGRVELLDELECALSQCSTGLGRDEVSQHDDARFSESIKHFRAQEAVGRCRENGQ